jgi:hypothetical protein
VSIQNIRTLRSLRKALSWFENFADRYDIRRGWQERDGNHGIYRAGSAHLIRTGPRSKNQCCGSGSFYKQAKIVRKTLISTILWLLYIYFEKLCKSKEVNLLAVWIISGVCTTDGAEMLAGIGGAAPESWNSHRCSYIAVFNWQTDFIPTISVSDPWYFGADPDPRIHASD